MLTQRVANVAFNVLVLLAAAYFAYVAEGFETSGLLASTGLESKFFPQLMLAVTALCSVIVIATYVFRGSAGGDAGTTVFGTWGDARRGLLTLVVAVACYLIWSLWSFIPMAIVVGPACALAMGVRSIRIHVSLLVMSGVVFFVFSRFLGVQFT